MITSVKKEFGSIDILVNNAGITKDNLIMKMSEEEFDKVIEVNLKGAFNCMKHVSRIMLKQRSGHIINMSSVSGVMGNAGQVNYCASKAGIIGMTKSLARELGSRGITVNAIAPGFIETEMTDVLSEDVKENLLGSIPLKRMGQTKDIAETVAFLASDKAAYITGQTISVDGGMGNVKEILYEEHETCRCNWYGCDHTNRKQRGRILEWNQRAEDWICTDYIF